MRWCRSREGHTQLPAKHGSFGKGRFGCICLDAWACGLLLVVQEHKKSLCLEWLEREQPKTELKQKKAAASPCLLGWVRDQPGTVASELGTWGRNVMEP